MLIYGTTKFSVSHRADVAPADIIILRAMLYYEPYIDTTSSIRNEVHSMVKIQGDISLDIQSYLNMTSKH
jgi:hypothetical protein